MGPLEMAHECFMALVKPCWPCCQGQGAHTHTRRLSLAEYPAYDAFAPNGRELQ